MYGDTEVTRRHVARLREQGGDIRTMADRLISQVESIAWTGRAADTMRERVRDRALRLREVATRHDTAADSLEKHVGAVDVATETIATRERKATALVGDARARVASIKDQQGHAGLADPHAVRRVPDPVDEQLVAFTPPAAGHKDWLSVDLPGL